MKKVNEGLCVLELGTEERRMHPTLVYDNENVILIDAGLPEQLEEICTEVDKVGMDFEKINKIIITHHDLDHIGSLAISIKNSPNKIEVLAHNDEKPYIEGDKTPIKFTQDRFLDIPEEKRQELLSQIRTLHTKIDRTIKDDDELPYCGGIKIIHTPGHTPGHICLYLKKYKTLVTGDALNVVDGELVGPKLEYTFDMNQAIESLKKLCKYDIDAVICYHGGLFTNNINKTIEQIIARHKF